jgi:hypothetical protein
LFPFISFNHQLEFRIGRIEIRHFVNADWKKPVRQRAFRHSPAPLKFVRARAKLATPKIEARIAAPDALPHQFPVHKIIDARAVEFSICATVIRHYRIAKIEAQYRTGNLPVPADQ